MMLPWHGMLRLQGGLSRWRKVLKVRMYEGAAQVERVGAITGPQDASSSAAAGGFTATSSSGSTPPVVLTCLFLSPLLSHIVVGLNLSASRIALLFTIAYDRTQATGGWLFWLSL